MNNLPPGVSEGMIPGNRPEDMDEEAFWDLIYSKLDADVVAWLDDADDTVTKHIHTLVGVARDLGYIRGSNEAEQDSAIADLQFTEAVSEQMETWLRQHPDATASQGFATLNEIVQEVKRRG